MSRATRIAASTVTVVDSKGRVRQAPHASDRRADSRDAGRRLWPLSCHPRPSSALLQTTSFPRERDGRSFSSRCSQYTLTTQSKRRWPLSVAEAGGHNRTGSQARGHLAGAVLPDWTISTNNRGTTRKATPEAEAQSWWWWTGEVVRIAPNQVARICLIGP